MSLHAELRDLRDRYRRLAESNDYLQHQRSCATGAANDLTDLLARHPEPAPVDGRGDHAVIGGQVYEVVGWWPSGLTSNRTLLVRPLSAADTEEDQTDG